MIIHLRQAYLIAVFLGSFLIFGLVSCQSTPEQASTSPTAVSSDTDPLVPTLPPTELPLSTNIEPRSVNFPAENGDILNGTLYGQGTQGVIFSNINQGDETAWVDTPQAIQEKGYIALTYNYRTLGRAPEERAQKIEDLKAAISFLRNEGIQEIVLVGASIGGAASIKVAVEEQPAGLIIISTSMTLPSLEVTEDDLQAIAAPKLFLNSEMDMFGTTPDSEMMFEAASEPKTLFFYEGNAHGTALLSGEHNGALIERLVMFIEESFE